MVYEHKKEGEEAQAIELWGIKAAALVRRIF